MFISTRNGRYLRWFGAASFSLVLSLFVTGCLCFDSDDAPHSRSRGVSLSEAMQASARGSGESLGGRSGGGGSSDGGHFEMSFAGGGGGEVSGGSGGGGGAGDLDGVALSVTAEQIVPFENYIRGVSRVALEFAEETDFDHFGFSVGLGAVEFRDRSLPDLAVEDGRWLDLGLNYRRYFSPPHTFLRPYGAVGLYVQGMSWEYRNAIIVAGDVIHRDAIGGGGGYVGGGLLVNAGSRLKAFGEARVGEALFDGETSEGFRNNVLDNFGYYSFRAGVSVAF